METRHPTTTNSASRRGAAALDPSRWRDNLGAALLFVCVAGAILAAVTAADTVADADAATEAVETWRLVGYAFFAGVFVLLALAPRQLRGLWELTIVA